MSGIQGPQGAFADFMQVLLSLTGLIAVVFGIFLVLGLVTGAIAMDGGATPTMAGGLGLENLSFG